VGGAGGSHQFGLTAAMALIVGSIIGVGIFNLPTSLAAYGPITLVSMALTTVGALALALLFASLSRRLPADGGPYAYARVASATGSGSTRRKTGCTRSRPCWSPPSVS
jgi:basic amino acid/polyamine antiporter, APA family